MNFKFANLHIKLEGLAVITDYEYHSLEPSKRDYEYPSLEPSMRDS